MAPSRLAFFSLALTTLAVACATPQKSEREPRLAKRTAPVAPVAPVPLTRGMVPRLDAVRPETPDPMELGTYNVTRQISMYYRLDLLRDNVHSRAMSEIMHIYDAPVRACYVDRLEAKPALKGDVDLSFAISKERGGMQRIQHVGGSLNDPVLVKCLKRRLAEIPFQAARNMQGKLRYQFNSMATGAARLTPTKTAAER